MWMHTSTVPQTSMFPQMPDVIKVYGILRDWVLPRWP